ncbi:MAG: redoxin domain-containing protein [Rikenellaceae bacterium]|nr:redoxin domain-containing protein [Rikenellaceae bacterium]
MKKQLIVVLAALGMVACNSQKVYTIEGTLADFSGKVALTDNRGEALAEVETNAEGAFKLEYESEYPFMGLLRIDDGDENVGERYIAQIYGDDVMTIKVTGTSDDLIIEGGAANAVNSQVRALNQQIVEREVAGATREELIAFYEGEMERLYNENKDNLYGVMYMARQKSYDMTGEEIMAAIEALPKTYKTMPSIEKLGERAEALIRVGIGKQFTDIEAPDAEGNMVKLSDVVKANKYVLLDFWASWCGPCMGEVPYLVEAYKEYHPLGFEIYGVSLDKTKEPWLRAIENKGLVWVNVSNLQYWQEPAAALYGVGSIPSNFLIDAEGNIVAHNLRGEALAEKLAELLK